MFDQHEAWYRAGFLTCAQWLSWRIGVGPKAAREKVRVARALRELPRIDASFGRGELSYSKVRALTRVATPVTEQDLLDLALHATASQLDRLVRSYARCVESASVTRTPSERRYVRRSEAFGSMVEIEMLLAPEEAAVVWEAIEAASDRAPAGASGDPTAESNANPGAQASAGASGDPAAESNTTPSAQASAGASLEEPPPEQRRADAIMVAAWTSASTSAASCWTHPNIGADALDRSPRRSVGPCGYATAAAECPAAVGVDTSTATTSSTGPTAARPSSTTWSWSARDTTG